MDTLETIKQIPEVYPRPEPLFPLLVNSILILRTTSDYTGSFSGQQFSHLEEQLADAMVKEFRDISKALT